MLQNNNTSHISSRRLCALMQGLFLDISFYQASCQAVQELRGMRYVFPKHLSEQGTLSMSWTDAFILLRLWGDNIEGGEEALGREESQRFRMAYLQQLLCSPSSKPTNNLLVSFASLKIGVRIICSERKPVGVDLHLAIESLA